MSGVFRRCGCRDANGKTYGVLPVKGATPAQQARACPTMSTDPKHGSFSWRLSRGFDPVTGKRVQVNGGTFTTLKAAQVALNKAKVKKDEGTLHKPVALTLASYAGEWLPKRQTMGKRPLAPTTALNYKRYIEQDIAPSRLGRMKLSDIRRSDVQAFRDGLVKSGRGATTVNRLLAVVMSILTTAVRDELVPVNVARGVEGPTVTRTEKVMWTDDQLAAFLAVAAGHRLGAAFEFCFFTALRRGELAGLRWSDIDRDRGVAMIRNNRVKLDAKTIEKSTKNKSSTAEVPLSQEALAALDVWKLRQDIERDEWGDAYEANGYVFTMEDGRPVDPSYLTRLFDKLRAETEQALRKRQREALQGQGLTDEAVDNAMQKNPVALPYLTLHGLRHLALTIIYEETGDIMATSKAARHSSTGVTSSVYVHMSVGKQGATFSSIGKRLGRSGAHTLHTHAPQGA